MKSFIVMMRVFLQLMSGYILVVTFFAFLDGYNSSFLPYLDIDPKGDRLGTILALSYLTALGFGTGAGIAPINKDWLRHAFTYDFALVIILEVYLVTALPTLLFPKEQGIAWWLLGVVMPWLFGVLISVMPNTSQPLLIERSE